VQAEGAGASGQQRASITKFIGTTGIIGISHHLHRYHIVVTLIRTMSSVFQNQK
jgi:hypothetical protein